MNIQPNPYQIPPNAVLQILRNRLEVRISNLNGLIAERSKDRMVSLRNAMLARNPIKRAMYLSEAQNAIYQIGLYQKRANRLYDEKTLYQVLLE